MDFIAQLNLVRRQVSRKGHGFTSSWVDYPGGGISPVTVTINPANPSVLLRLVSL
jgi:hypothetical protein